MINLAGKKSCDDYIPKELDEAGIEPTRMPFKFDGEVPTNYCGFLDGWTFKRAWYYWVASSNANPLLFKHADELYKKFKNDVRVEGHCGCPVPREHLDKPWYTGVSLYHVDTQEGLKALADMIKLQTKENFQKRMA